MSYDNSVIDEVGSGPSVAIMEMQADFEDVVGAGRRSDDVEDRYVKLGDTRIALEHFVASGKGINNQVYGLLRLNINHLTNKITGTRGLMSLESYNNPDPVELALALENVVTQTLKDIWTAIKTAFINTKNKIKAWYIKAWDGSVRLQKQAEAIKARVDNITGVAKETSFDFAGARYLSLDYRPASPEAIVAGIKNINGISNNFLNKNANDYTTLCEKLLGVVKTTVEAAKKMKDSDATPAAAGTTPTATPTTSAGPEDFGSGTDNALLGEILKRHAECLKAIGITAPLTNTADTRFNDTNITYQQRPDTLLGDIILVGMTPPAVTNNESYLTFKTGLGIGVESKDAKPREIEDTAQFKTLSAANILNICDDTIEICKVFTAYRLLFDKRNVATDKIIKELETAAFAANDLKGVGERHVRASIQTTSQVVRKIDAAESRWSKYAMQVCTRAINLCKVSITKY